MSRTDFMTKYLYTDDPEMTLIAAGIIPERMEYLSYNERVHILQNAGLDPEEFDF